MRVVGSITKLMIEEWVRGLCSLGLSAGTVRQCFRILRCVLDDAVDRGLIGASPCKRIGLPRVSPSSALFLGPSSVARLAACIEPRFSALVLTAAYLGLRWGELAGLLRTGVDFSASLVRVVGTLEEVAGIVRYVSETKSRGGRRSLTVPPFLVSVLSSHLESFGVPPSLVPLSVDAPSVPGGSLPSSEFVFTDVDGGVLRGSRFRRRYWRPAVLAAGLPSGLRFHDLRHTCASLLIAQGAHPKEIQARLGHSSIKTTLDTYGHLLPNLGARLDEGLEKLFREAGGRDG